MHSTDDPPETSSPAPPDGKEVFLELPEYSPSEGSGNFTGFNSVDLQEIYVVQKQAAVRSQISPRGGHKPCLALLPDGDLLATQKTEGRHVALCRSGDQGLTWGPPRRVEVPGEGKLTGRAAMFSALADGTLLLGAAGTIYRSNDEGQTWEQSRIDRSVEVADQSYDIGWGENSGPHELPDGTVVCSGYISFKPGHTQAYLLRSTDGGRTWGDASRIAPGSEANLAVLPDDRLFACLRVATDGAGEGGAALAVTESSDRGRTWSRPRRILGKAQSPGFPICLPDGRLIIVYTHRQFPHGAQAIASRDGGGTWDTEHPVILAWFSWDSYCGHPRSLVLPDRSIATGYYSRVFTENQGPDPDIVGHCLRWLAPAGWPAEWPPTPAPLRPPAGKSPALELPAYSASGGSGNYTGFNSVNLQEIYFVEKKPAVRSQISPRGGHKPCMARLPGGDLLATQISGDRHMALCRSEDQGFSWGPPGEIAVPGTGKLSGRAPMFAARADGTLLLGAAGTIYRSSDQGQTWRESRVDRSVTVAGETYEIGWGESDGPHELSDGTIICSGYVSLEPGHPQAYLLRSTDGGETWGDASRIADASEVNMAVLPGDELFGCLRVATDGAGEGGAVVAVTRSGDGGRTWTSPRRIPGLGRAQIPGFPLRLDDGRLLIIHGNRQFPFGAQVIGSRNGGETWDTEHPIILAWFSWDNYCGHPRSVLLPAGRIATGYYARVFTGAHGIVLTPTDRHPDPDVVGHCLQWRVPDDWPAQG